MNFEFRPFSFEDVPLMHEWLNRPHVAEWWHGRATLEEVEEDCAERIASAFVASYLACLDGTLVGYIQVYHVMSPSPDWWKDETDPGARGIDQFLANASQIGKGIGTAMITQFVNKLFRDPEVTKIQVDPAPNNLRAIRAYEKCGFRREGLVDTPDGPALLMVLRRDDG